MHKRREGFTLIELLIVIVIIGILAAIAIPKFGATREKAYIKAMESDLRNLAAQQEIYYSDSGSNYEYFGGTIIWSDATSGEDLNINLSSGVQIVVTADNTATRKSWSAVATHEASDQQCEIFTGDEAPTTLSHADAPGIIRCGDKAAA